jgi:DNA polymerase alpha-associated DNA helicase A
LAGDPMQLPPTVLSNSKRDKKNKEKNKAQAVVSKPNQPGKSLDNKGGKAENHVKAPQDTDQSTSESSESEDDQDTTPEAEVATLREEKPSIALRPPRTLEITLFERLEKMYGPRIKCMLDVQYRCVCI